jgi:putative transposase
MRKYKKSGANPLSQLENEGKPTTRARRISQEITEQMNRYIREEYLKATRPPAKAIYELFVAEIEADNLHREPDQQLSIPSRMTFSRAIYALDPYVVDLTRLGKETARRRQRYGKAILAPCRIGQRVEVDSHLMDVIVVDEDGNQIGRPWLCAMICVYTRCIIGWEISFTPPCAAKVLRALRHAMSDATPRIFSGSPEELILDNGPEFQNTVLQTVAGTYGVALRYVEPRSPNEKPHIERFFGTVNTQLVHMMLGTTRSNPDDRGEYDSVKNATLRLEEVRDRFAFWLDSVYHKSPHSALQLPPSEMWRIGMEVFAPTRYPDVDLNITCRSFVARSISGGRVGFANLSWTGPSLPEIAARLAAKGAGTKTQVYYDETDLSFVWVQDPDDRSLLYKADAVDPAYQAGLSLYEHELLQQVLRKQGKAFSTPELREAKAKLYWLRIAPVRANNWQGCRSRVLLTRLALQTKSRILHLQAPLELVPRKLAKPSQEFRNLMSRRILPRLRIPGLPNSTVFYWNKQWKIYLAEINFVGFLNLSSRTNCIRTLSRPWTPRLVPLMRQSSRCLRFSPANRELARPRYVSTWLQSYQNPM